MDTDSEKADTAVFVETYGADLIDASANLVVVAAKKSGVGAERVFAACLVLPTARADVNGAVRRRLGVRKVPFAPHETAVNETGMEYGGIMPLGLPASWSLLVDAEVAAPCPGCW